MSYTQGKNWSSAGEGEKNKLISPNEEKKKKKKKKKYHLKKGMKVRFLLRKILAGHNLQQVPKIVSATKMRWLCR